MKLCSIPNCGMKLLARGYCSKHYYRLKRTGSALSTSRFDDRPAIQQEQFTKIPLGIEARQGYAIVDNEFKYLERYAWGLSIRGYPYTRIEGRHVCLHHLVLGKPPLGAVTDHISRDKLDNRKANLRHVSQKANMRNVGVISTNTSGYKGVTRDRRTNKWVAQASFNGGTQYGGSYVRIEDAVKARKELEERYKV